MIDLHTHVLWELDDGADSFETAKAMLSQMHMGGTACVVCTPHAFPGYRPFDLEKYNERLHTAQKWADKALPGLTLLQGAEIAWTYHTAEALRRKQLPTLNQSHYALIEFAPRIPLSDLRGAVYKLSSIGITPVIAHAERIRCLMWQPQKALGLKKELPVHFQMNAYMLLAKLGPIQSRFVKIMLDNRAIDAVASDCHNLSSRPPLLAEAHKALARLTDPAYADQCVRFHGVCE